MKIELEVESINYGELIAAFLPQLKELSDDPIVKAISYVPSNLAGSVVKHIPQSALDLLVATIVEKKKKVILESIEQLAEKKGFHLALSDIHVNQVPDENET